MRMAILVRSGSLTIKRIVLRAGQIAKFGRTDWADFSFPEDLALSDVHFQIECASDRGLLRTLCKDRETLINGQPVKESLLQNGDRINAGKSTFFVEMEDVAKTQAAEAPILSAAPPPPKDETERTAIHIQLSQQAIALAKMCDDPSKFEMVLQQQELLEDAIHWRAFRLPKPAAVAWAIQCIEIQVASDPNEPQRISLDAARKWSKEPSEENRRVAEGAAKSVGNRGIGGMIATAVAWSGGSLAPPNLPPVPPDPRLTAQALSAALTLASTTASPRKAKEVLRDFLALVSPQRSQHSNG